MLATGDPFSPALRKALLFNYDPNVTHKPPRNEPVLPPDTPPLSFYDRHIACNLVLKQLVYLPSLSHSLSKLCENTIEKFTSDGNKFYQQGFRIYPGNPDFKHAGSVRDYYIANAGSLGHSFASIALLHPSCPSWASLLMLHDPMTRRHESPPFLTEASLQVRGYPEDGDLNFSEEYDKDLMEGLDGSDAG
ncbi:hypothetical protein M413DRAFT_26871 [Hebeloma cylindrosporum]|uniref:Uncharacterized protein n=1 Tax=Hebeloma cylindrosporum TaxID=76867 RepID=A0A0C2YPC4_HEBCY|nr:hypothetical protein M413DRAFT_26871 [Hebeloma cylindrosporum h7]